MKLPSDQLESLKARQIQANQAVRPFFYRLQNENDLRSYIELLSHPGLIIVDTINDQLKELVKYRNPGQRFSAEALEAGVNHILSGMQPEAFGVWVYYPWSNRLVHCLDEEDFINIRTSRNQYKITREERDLLAQKKIGVIGLSVGQSVSVTIAMERLCGELRLADFDTLELNNLNRIRTGIHNLGLPKVYSVAREIAEIDPFLKVQCFTQGLTEENMDTFFNAGGKLDLLIEESDGFDIKILSRYKARELRIPVLMEASDRCMVDVERFDLEPERSILHGIVDHLDVNLLKSLTTNEEKIPYMLDVLGIETSSLRLKASMVEMNQTINTWPQLASAVTMGGGITADVARRLLLNQYTESGRYHVDIEEIIGNKKTAPPAPEPVRGAALSVQQMEAACKSYKDGSASGADDDTLAQLVAAATLAPSYANQQPWKWVSHQQRLFLFFQPRHAASVIDAALLGAHAALGAAVENLSLKAQALGFEPAVQLWPSAAHPQLAAVIALKKTGATAPALEAFIGSRHTNPKPGSGRPLAADILESILAQAAPAAGNSLALITDPEQIGAMAAAAGMAQRMCLLQPACSREYFSDLHWSSGPVTEGVDIKALELPMLAETALKVIADARVAGLLHEWDKGIAFQKMTAGVVATSSALGLVTASSNSPADILNAGRLVQKAWLAATKNNLAFQPICLPLYLLRQLDNKDRNKIFSIQTVSELEYIKQQFLRVFPGSGSAHGVFLFRLSEAQAPAARSLRKPLNEVYFKL